MQLMWQLASGVFAILITVTWTKSIAIPQMLSKIESDVTKEALNCTASL